MAILEQRRVDFKMIKGNKYLKSWSLTSVDEAGVETPYPTANNFKLFLYDRQSPAAQVYEIASPSDKGAGYVTFEFLVAQTDFSGLYDYQIREEDGLALITVAYGTIQFVDLSKFIPFGDLVVIESPGGVTVPEAFVNAKSYEWRNILKTRGSSELDAALVERDDTWPLLYNVLIAKLVVNDFLVKALKSSMISGSSSSSSSSSETAPNSTGIKSIETGPTKVEFQDSMKSVSEFMKTAGGNNALTSLQGDICGLASTLKLKLEICKDRVVPVVPQYQGLDTPATAMEILSKYYQ